VAAKRRGGKNTISMSFEEPLALGAAISAILIAFGISIGKVPAVEGGVLVMGLCGSSVFVRIILMGKGTHRRQHCQRQNHDHTLRGAADGQIYGRWEHEKEKTWTKAT